VWLALEACIEEEEEEEKKRASVGVLRWQCAWPVMLLGC
jgi:hypothetical protein